MTSHPSLIKDKDLQKLFDRCDWDSVSRVFHEGNMEFHADEWRKLFNRFYSQGYQDAIGEMDKLLSTMMFKVEKKRGYLNFPGSMDSSETMKRYIINITIIEARQKLKEMGR